MQASKLPNPVYKCVSCGGVFNDAPKMEPVIDPEELDDNEYYTFKEAFDEAGRCRWICGDGCDVVLDKDQDQRDSHYVQAYFTVYDPAWRCGNCNTLHQELPNAMSCCL